MTPEQQRILALRNPFAPQPFNIIPPSVADRGPFTTPDTFGASPTPSGGGIDFGGTTNLLTSVINAQQQGQAQQQASQERIVNRVTEPPHAREADGNMFRGGANDPWSNGFFKTDAQRQGVIDSRGGGNLDGSGYLQPRPTPTPVRHATDPNDPAAFSGPILNGQDSNGHFKGAAYMDSQAGFRNGPTGFTPGPATSMPKPFVAPQFAATPTTSQPGFGDLHVAEQGLPTGAPTAQPGFGDLQLAESTFTPPAPGRGDLQRQERNLPQPLPFVAPAWSGVGPLPLFDGPVPKFKAKTPFEMSLPVPR